MPKDLNKEKRQQEVQEAIERLCAELQPFVLQQMESLLNETSDDLKESPIADDLVNTDLLHKAANEWLDRKVAQRRRKLATGGKMSKTPEEMAEEYREEHDECEFARDAFLAGYNAGSEITEQEIADIIVDIRKREEEERKKLPAHKQQRHDHIWEKIKVKIIGVF